MLLHRKKLPKTREAVIEWSHRFEKQVTAMKYALTNGVILDGSKDMQPQRGKTVLTDGEIITAIVQDDADLNGYTVIDLQNRYLMPGLINMHVHLAGNGKPQKKQRDNEALVKKIMASGLTRAVAYRMVAGFAKLELLSGVTTIRTVQLRHAAARRNCRRMPGRSPDSRCQSRHFRPRRAHGRLGRRGSALE